MPQKVVDMVGEKIGRLTVISRAENTSQNKAQWLCKCDCGNMTVVSRRHLKDRSTLSCGCLAKEKARVAHTTHGMRHTRIYRIWAGVKDRCCNANGKYWERYGGKGITICEEWAQSFENFYKWSMGNGYADDLTIDRINNSKGYSPENCRWATYKTQENNRGNNRILECNNEKHTISQWSDITGIKQSTISQRIRNGWNVEKALTVKSRRRENG